MKDMPYFDLLVQKDSNGVQKTPAANILDTLGVNLSSYKNLSLGSSDIKTTLVNYIK